MSKNVVVKCSPKIPNYIINLNNDYVYFDSVRSKAYDRFFVPQCYHCRRFNHFVTNCHDKTNYKYVIHVQVIMIQKIVHVVKKVGVVKMLVMQVFHPLVHVW